MASYERYRIWKKDNTYEVAVARNRDEAIGIAIGKGVKRNQIKAVGKATSRGRLFKVKL